MDACAFSPDGTRVVAVSSDNTLKLVELETGRVTTLQGHTQSVGECGFSSDGTRIVSASWDKTVRLWDVASGHELATYRGPYKKLPRPTSACARSCSSASTATRCSSATPSRRIRRRPPGRDQPRRAEVSRRGGHRPNRGANRRASRPPQPENRAGGHDERSAERAGPAAGSNPPRLRAPGFLEGDRFLSEMSHLREEVALLQSGNPHPATIPVAAALLARSGLSRESRTMIGFLDRHGFTSGHLRFVEGEVARAEGNTAEAISALREAMRVYRWFGLADPSRGGFPRIGAHPAG